VKLVAAVVVNIGKEKAERVKAEAKMQQEV
jgi:hypothetical protein